MAFIVNVIAQVNGGQGTRDIDQLEQGLDDTTQAAGRATTALKGMGEGAAQGMDKASDALEKYRQELDAKWAAINQTKFDDQNLKRINAPMEEFKAQLASIDRLLVADKLSMEQYDAELVKLNEQLNKSQPKLSDELLREQQILEKINGPMREYQAQVAALDGLLKKSEIDLETYNRELKKAGDAAGKGLGPVLGPKPPGAAGAPDESGGAGAGGLLQAIAPQLGQGGQILGQFASGGTLAAAGVAALAVELVHLGDQYRDLANHVERFTTETVSANDIIHQQLDLSKELHSSLEGAADLYVRARESTHELNLSSRQQLGLAHDLGVEIAAQGRSAEDAAGLMRRLSLAFETGTIAGRELRGIMKQYPELATELAAALGHTTSELIQLANKGQISGQQLIDAIHKIAPESEKAVGAMREGVGAWFGHMWDDLKVEVGGAVDWYRSQYDSYSEIAAANAVRSRRTREESARQLNAELEKNAKAAQIAGAAGGLGIAMPGFDQAAADSIAQMRMTARAAGFDIADAFADAKAKAQLYGTEIEKIRDARAAKEIADDAKRIYEALYGADDLIKDQVRHWQSIRDEVSLTREAILKLQATRFVSGAPQTQDERDLALKAQNAQTSLPEQVGQYGAKMVSYAQGINTAKAALDELNRASKAGVIGGAALQQQYDSIMTTLNDGRLPEAIKIWEGLTLPVEQSIRDFSALDALLKSGRIGVSSYVDELKKIADTHKSGDATEISLGIARIHQEIDRGVLSWNDYDKAVRKLVDSMGKYQTTASGIRFRAEIKGPDGLSSLLQNNEQLPASKGLTDNPELKGILARYQSAGIAQGASEDVKLLNNEIERGLHAMDDFIAPSVKYEQRIKEIDLAVRFGGFSEEQITAARRRAKDTLNQETEALEAQKGPMEAYAAAQRKLKDQLDAGDISQRKYTEGLDKAKETMLQATGAAETFSGAMQINWIKMKQDAEGFGATVANLAVADFGKLNDAIVTAANGGAVSWSQMADAMIQDLERVALKMAEIGLIKGAIGLFSGLGGGGGGLADTGNFGAEFGAGNYGFATGGSFLVGGDGGTDTTHVGFRATRGERVTITPPGAYPYPQAPSGGAAMAGGAAVAPVVHVHNYVDSSVAVAAIASPAGQSAIGNVIRANAPAIRAALGIR